MAQADNESNTPAVHVLRAPHKAVRREVYVRPGVRLVSEVCQELGTDQLRGQIVSGKRKAFELYPGTGEMREMRPDRFCTEGADEVLERGFYFVETSRWGYVGDERDLIHDYYPVFVVVEDIPPMPRPVPATPTVPEYIPPFVALMLEAVQAFKISADNPSPVIKEELTKYFTGKIVEGWPVSATLADTMATLCRPPEAMWGGRKGSKKDDSNR